MIFSAVWLVDSVPSLSEDKSQPQIFHLHLIIRTSHDWTSPLRNQAPRILFYDLTEVQSEESVFATPSYGHVPHHFGWALSVQPIQQCQLFAELGPTHCTSGWVILSQPGLLCNPCSICIIGSNEVQLFPTPKALWFFVFWQSSEGKFNSFQRIFNQTINQNPFPFVLLLKWKLRSDITMTRQ